MVLGVFVDERATGKLPVSRKANVGESRERGNIMLVWLVDDDRTLCDSSERFIAEERDVDSLNIHLKTIRSFKDFESSLEALEGGGADYPGLIFLDLKFKSVELGYQALDRIKNHERMSIRSIPTIMFSSTGDSGAIKKTYRKSANAYVEKGPSPYDSFRKALEHWRQEMRLPKTDATSEKEEA